MGFLQISDIATEKRFISVDYVPHGFLLFIDTQTGQDKEERGDGEKEREEGGGGCIYDLWYIVIHTQCLACLSMVQTYLPK